VTPRGVEWCDEGRVEEEEEDAEVEGSAWKACVVE
jgi:hypothetical protein